MASARLCRASSLAVGDNGGGENRGRPPQRRQGGGVGAEVPVLQRGVHLLLQQRLRVVRLPDFRGPAQHGRLSLGVAGEREVAQLVVGEQIGVEEVVHRVAVERSLAAPGLPERRGVCGPGEPRRKVEAREARGHLVERQRPAGLEHRQRHEVGDADQGIPHGGAEVGHRDAEILGFWLLIDGREFYVPFAEFPWFEDATIAELGIVERPSREHLFWPRLDVDLSLASLEDPDCYPLVSRRPADHALPSAEHARERPSRYLARKRR